VFDLDGRRAAWLERVFRRSHSVNSRHAAEMALKAFDKVFGMPAEDVIEDVRRGKLDVYKVFERFVSELDKAGLSPHTINGYVNRVKQYFAYNDVVLDKTAFRVKVGLPRVSEPDDRAPTVEELRRILAWGKLRTKALILVLASSGMRLGEAIRLKVGDIDFNSRPVRVQLSPKVASKTGEGRITYISDEAAEYLRQYLGERINYPEAWVFPSEADESRHMSEDRAWRTIVDCIEKAGLGKAKEKTVMGRRKLHPHSLRKFFFSRVVGVIGETAAHALMGHGSYLKTYYKRPEEERARDYLRCMPQLTIFTESADMKRWKDEAKIEAIKAFAKSLGIENIEVRIAKLKEEKSEISDEKALSQIIRESLGIMKLNMEKRNSNNDPKKIVNENELERFLAQGWDVQTVLPSGKILIRKAS